MKTAILPALAAISTVSADINTWKAPGAYDARAPCPMLNSLANHGFLPHHGRDLDRDTVAGALFDALNINETVAGFLFEFGLLTSPKPNATTWSLNDLGNHNILEHDGSLSRSDAYYGNPLPFNQSVFDETKSYFTGDIVNMQMAADARAARIRTSRNTNPTFALSELGSEFAFGESAAYVLFLGDQVTGTANRTWIEWFFEHEELPRHLGWKRPTTEFQEADLERWMNVVKSLTPDDPLLAPTTPEATTTAGATTTPEATPAVRRSKRAVSHWGF